MLYKLLAFLKEKLCEVGLLTGSRDEGGEAKGDGQNINA